MNRRDFLKTGAGVSASLMATSAFGGFLDKGIPFYISEYPTWAAFKLAEKRGILKKMEQKYGVKLDVQVMTYDACTNAYGTSGGAVCITNTDIVSQVKQRPSIAILPTSTSVGADALLGVGVSSLNEIVDKKIPVYGLDGSVSRFVFDRCVEKKGFKANQFSWKGMDPEQVAQGMQGGKIQAGVVWNPFTIQTERSSRKVARIADSTLLPGEVIDMVCMDTALLATERGQNAAKCICAMYYETMAILDNPDKEAADDAYLALGGEFTNLNAPDMRLCLKQTHTYTPEEAVRTFSQRHIEANMDIVCKWAVSRDIISTAPTIGVDAQLGFDPRYILMVVGKLTSSKPA